MVVFFQSKPVLQNEDLNAISSFKELIEILAIITSIASENIKLIANGKVLSSSTFNTEVLTSKIFMVGSSAPPVTTVPDTSFRIKNDMSNEGVEVQATPDEKSFDRRLRAKRELANPYRFHGLETLPNMHDEARALELLQLLSSDPGVLAVMKKHKWNVGMLCEMYPEGYVGVSDVCILGLNQNKGQKIFLRLRTDDLKGFRKLLSIKKVLYHELAHNEHSDHDDKFYVLMRQIEREVVDLDWRQSTRGHVLGHARHAGVQRLQEDLEEEEVIAASSGPGPGPGPERETEEASDHAVHVTDSHGSMSDSDMDREKDNSMEEDEDYVGTCDTQSCPCGCVRTSSLPSIVCQTCAPCPPSSQDVLSQRDSEVNIMSLAEPFQSNDVVAEISDMSRVAKQHEENYRAARLSHLISQRIISDIDEMLASFYAMQQEPPERVVQLRQALCEMLVTVGDHERFKDEVSRQSIAQLLETLTLLRDIINRAKDSHDPKYRSLNRTKRLFQRVLTETKALPILFAVGFEQPNPSSDYLSLVRDDPVVLFMFVDILDRTIQASKDTLVDFIALEEGRTREEGVAIVV